MKQDLVWYAVYGSNLHEDRFMCYIKGGKPSGSNKDYEPCNDISNPVKTLQYKINYELIFSKNSKTWQNGGVAFINKIKNYEQNTYAKLYLITKEQFNHIAKGETSSTERINIDFENTISTGSSVFKQHSWYGMALYIGEIEGYPILTLTSEYELKDFKKPSSDYLSQIIKGLKETHSISHDDIFEYLKSKNGILKEYLDSELSSIISKVLG